MEILAPGIVVFNDVIPDQIDLINRINYLAETKVFEWQESMVGGENGGRKIDKSSRNCRVISIHHGFPEDFIPMSEKEISSMFISNLFRDFFSPLLNQYFNRYKVTDITSHENYQILRYGVDEKFGIHTDDHWKYPRRVSLTWYANDDFEGGEIEFPEFGLKIKPKKNQLLIFCSSFPYIHEVHPVTSGERYAVVQWMF